VLLLNALIYNRLDAALKRILKISLSSSFSKINKVKFVFPSFDPVSQLKKYLFVFKEENATSYTVSL